MIGLPVWVGFVEINCIVYSDNISQVKLNIFANVGVNKYWLRGGSCCRLGMVIIFMFELLHHNFVVKYFIWIWNISLNKLFRRIALYNFQKPSLNQKHCALTKFNQKMKFFCDPISTTTIQKGNKKPPHSKSRTIK